MDSLRHVQCRKLEETGDTPVTVTADEDLKTSTSSPDPVNVEMFGKARWMDPYRPPPDVWLALFPLAPRSVADTPFPSIPFCRPQGTPQPLFWETMAPLHLLSGDYFLFPHPFSGDRLALPIPFLGATWEPPPSHFCGPLRTLLLHEWVTPINLWVAPYCLPQSMGDPWRHGDSLFLPIHG